MGNSKRAMGMRRTAANRVHKALCLLLAVLLGFWAVPAGGVAGFVGVQNVAIAVEQEQDTPTDAQETPQGAILLGDAAQSPIALETPADATGDENTARSPKASTDTTGKTAPDAITLSPREDAADEANNPDAGEDEGEHVPDAQGQTLEPESTEPAEDEETPAALHAQDAGGNHLTMACENLSKLEKDANGVILYDLVNDTTQTITLHFEQGIFSDDWLNVAVTLPRYGFQFTDNLIADLNDQAEIRNAAFAMDANGYNTKVTFQLYGSASAHHYVDVQTKYAPLTDAQCADAIANGWQDSTLAVEVSKADGTPLEHGDSTKVRPREGTPDNVISVATHEWNTPANKYTWASGQILDTSGNGSWNDKIRVTTRIVGGDDDTALVRFDSFKLYVPGNEKNVELYDWNWTQSVYYGTRDYKFHDYFTCDKVRYTDAAGDYYLFTAKPGKVFYNKGTTSKTDTVLFEGAVRWRMVDEDENGNEVVWLNESPTSTTYAAADMQIGLTSTENRPQVASGPGSVFHTPKVRYYNPPRRGFTRTNGTVDCYPTYRKTYDESLGRYTSKKKVVAGSSYSNQSFVPFYNDSGIQNYRAANIDDMTDWRGAKADVTEIYDFPYEIRPTSLSFRVLSSYVWASIDRVSYTVLKADGTEEVVEAPCPDSGFWRGTVDLTDGLPEGSRVSRVEIHWDRIFNAGSGNGYSCSENSMFSYDVTAAHENGDPLENGELLHIGYAGTFNDPGYELSFADAAEGGADDYLYLEVEDKKCPWLMAYLDLRGVNWALPVDYNSPTDVPLMTGLYLKGLSGGSYRDYLDDPTIELSMGASKDGGFTGGEWLAFLSPSMTMTKNLSGWHIDYSVRDGETGAERSAHYEIGQLDGDTPLTADMLGMKDSEYFTAFSLGKVGRATLETTMTDVQKTAFAYTQSLAGLSDFSPAGTYDLSFLLKDVKARPRITGADGSRLIGPNTITLQATLKHGGECDRAAHATGENKLIKAPGTMELRGYVPQRVFVSDYSYGVSGPNFSTKAEEGTVHQGGTIVSDMVFKLSYYHMPYTGTYAYATPFSQPVPYAGVGERLYIELTDPFVDVDLSNAVFQKSLAEHGMTTDDVSVIQADGKRWIRLSLPSGSSVAWGPKLRQQHLGISTGNYRTMDFPFKVALRVWSGHELGDCSPFGEVYYDLSDYPHVYDGGEASGYRTVVLGGTETNATTAALTGSSDAPLYRGDASGETFEVLRNYATGATVDPGKNGVVYLDDAMGYTSDERPTLFAAVSMNAPDPSITTYDYETVLRLPDAQATYSWVATGQQLSGTSDYGMQLAGAAELSKNTLGADSAVTFSYSVDGSDGSFVGAATAQANWSAYRYVKIHVDKIDPFKSLEVRFPVNTDESVAGQSKLAYLGGTWRYKQSAGGASTEPVAMAPAVYEMAPTVSIPVGKRLKAPANLGNGDYDHAYSFGEGKFQFRLTGVGVAPLPAAAVGGALTASVSAANVDASGVQTGGQAVFSGLEFTQTGTYRYEIREVIPDDALGAAGVKWSAATDAQKAQGGFMKDGVVYSERVSTVTVTVTRGSDGRLTATPSTVTGNPGAYENRYEVEDAALTLGGSKVLKNAQGEEITRSGFSFVLEETTGTGSSATTVVRRNAALAGDNKTFTFAPLEFTQTDLDAGGERVFRIREAIPENAVGTAGKTYKDSTPEQRAQNGYKLLGVTFDQTVYEARVTLADNHDGTMTPQVAYYRVTDKNGAALASPQVVQAQDIVFNNAYDCEATVTLQATKDLAGRSWADADAFTFKLEGMGQMENGTVGQNGQMTGGTPNASKPSPMPAGATGTTATATATKEHPTTSFAGIAFTSGDLGKTYAYKLTEVVPDSPEADMRYSTAEYGALVTPVADNGDGTMQVVVTYSLRVKGENGAADQRVPVHGLPTFVNKKVGQGTATIFADKDLEGRDWAAGDAFKFVLEPDHVEDSSGTAITVSVPMPADAVGGKAYATATPENESAGFGAISYTEAMEGNVYYYKVTEKAPDDATRVAGKWVKDGVVYSDDERIVRVTVGKISDADTRVTATVEYETTLSDGTEVWTGDIPADFDNFYTAAPVTVRDMQVQKQLKAPADLNVNNDYNQAYAFDAGRFSFTLVPGTYAEGKKSPMPKGEGGADLERVTVAAKAGTVDDEGKAHGGYAVFPAIEYTEPGSYSYTVTEVVPDDAVRASDDARYGDLAADDDKSGVWEKDGVTYTQAAHNVYVVVTDDGKGQLKATVSYRDPDNPGHLTDTPTVFTNRYHVWPQVTVSLSGEKSVNGLVAGEGYTFALTRQADEDSSRPDVAAPTRYASSDESGNFTFPELVYPQFRLGKTSQYFAYEVVPDAAVNGEGKAYGVCTAEERARGGFTLDGVTYDASLFQVSVKVVDNRDGTAHAEVAYKRVCGFDGVELAEPEAVDGIAFANVYAATPVTAQVKARKLLKAPADSATDGTNGRAYPFEGGVFSFTLTPTADANGQAAPMPEGKDSLTAEAAAGMVDADGEASGGIVTFEGVEFTVPGAYHYVIAENPPQGVEPDANGVYVKDGIAYTRDNRDVTVVVADDGKGELTAEVQYQVDSNASTAELATFTNLVVNNVDPEPCEADPPVRKVVEGSPDAPGEFTFTMTAADASYPMMDGAVDGVKTVTQTGAGAVEFGEITFTQPGTYEYTVQEVAGNDGSYTYDPAVWTVRYEVTADERLHLSAERSFLRDGEPVDAMEAVFTNVYEQPADPEPQPEPGTPAVKVMKSQDKTRVMAGEQVVYTLTATNEGDATATGVFVKDYVPAGTSYVASGGAGASYGATLTGDEFATWWIPSLAPGESTTLTLTVRVNECRPGDSFRNVAVYEEGDEQRPPALHDPGSSAGSSNAVSATVPSAKPTKAKTASAAGTGTPSTGDIPLAPAAFLALASACILLLASRRQRI